MALSSVNDDLYRRIAETIVRRNPVTPAQPRVAGGAGALPSFTQFTAMDVPEREPDWNLGQGFIDLLSSGTYATAGVGRKFGENIQAANRGEVGGLLDALNPFSLIGSIGSGLADRRTWGDNLRDWGADDTTATWAGLALDIAVDPLWLIPGGAIAAGFKGTTQGARLASTATKTGVQLTKPSVEAARDLTRSANEARLARGQQPTTTEQLIGGFNAEGRVIDAGDQRFGEIFQGTGQSLGAFSPQGLSNLVQGVRLGNAEVYSNWKTLRELSKTAKAEAKAAKAAGIISTDPIALGKNDVIAMDNLADALPRNPNDLVNEAGTVSERQADAIETAAQAAGDASEPLVRIEDVLTPPVAAEAATPTPEALRAFAQSGFKAAVDLRDRVLDDARVVYSPIAGSRLYKPEELVGIERTLDRATGARQLSPVNPVSRAAQIELNDMARLFETQDFAGLGAALAKVEPNLVQSGRIPGEVAEQAGSVVREVLDTPRDVTDLLEQALKAEGRPLADIPPFRPTTWRPPKNKYGKPSFSEDVVARYFPNDQLLGEADNLAIAFGRIPAEKAKVYVRVGENKAQAVARKQAQIWEMFRTRNFDELQAVRLQERSDWLAANNIPGSELFIRLEDGSMLGKGMMPDGFPAAAFTVHNGRPVTTVGAVLDAVVKGGGELSPILARWVQRNIDEVRAGIAKGGVKAPRGQISAADEDLIAERIWKQNPAIKSKADARLLAKFGPRAIAQLALKPQRQFFIDGPVDRATGVPATAVAGSKPGDEATLDVGRFIAGAGRNNTAESFLNQGRAVVGALADAIRRGEVPGEAGQAQALSSLMRDLGIKVADSASPQQVFKQFRDQAPARYEDIARRIQSAAKVESMGPQLEKVFAVSAAENVSIAQAVDKMDPEKVQAELRAFVDDVMDNVDMMCAGGDPDMLSRIVGGLSG